jgi:hypothetical protein
LGGNNSIDRSRWAATWPRWRIIATALSVVLAAAALGATTASARGLITGFTDNRIFDPSTSSSANREMWLDRAVAARAGIIRISVDWRNAVRRKPANPTNPADPAYGFVRLDQAIRSAKADGLDVVLTVYRAPAWAEGANIPAGIEPGAWKPEPGQYGKFGQALARRYSGHFRGLPQVSHFEVWTEPNLTQFLAPQWEGKKKWAPVRYRKMLNAFYTGVHTAQPDATVIAGATSPFGDSRKHQLYPGHPRMRPIVFLRTVLCLNAKLKRANCKREPHLDALSVHPINTKNGPHYKPHNKNDVQVANVGRVRKMLHAAERAKTVRPGGHHALWVTESGMLSDPPNPKGASIHKHALWLEESLYLLWKQGARVVLNLNIRDPAYDPNRRPDGQWTTGIFFRNGKQKPAFRSWSFPFVTHRKSKAQVKAWGKAPVGGKLKIQQRRHSHWRTRKRLRVHDGQVFTQTLRLRRHARLRAKVGQMKSLTWRQSG